MIITMQLGSIGKSNRGASPDFSRVNSALGFSQESLDKSFKYSSRSITRDQFSAGAKTEMASTKSALLNLSKTLGDAEDFEINNTEIDGWMSSLKEARSEVQGLSDYAHSPRLQGAEAALEAAMNGLEGLMDPTTPEKTLPPQELDTLLENEINPIVEKVAEKLKPLLSGEGSDGSTTIDITPGKNWDLNTYSAGNQDNSVIAQLSNGNIAAAWQDSDDGTVRYAVFDSEGEVVQAETVMTHNLGLGTEDYDPSITALQGGGFVIGRTINAGASSVGVLGDRFDNNGVSQGNPWVMNTTKPGDQIDVNLASLSDGGFVAVWEDESSGDFDVRAQRYDANGTAVGGEFLVNSTTANSQYDPTVTGLEDGGFVVAWTTATGGGSKPGGSNIMMQRYDSNGDKASAEIVLNEETAGYQNTAKITGLSDGGFVAVFESQDEDDLGIKGVRFDAAGNRVGSEFLINTQQDEAQSMPTVTELTDGKFVVAWHSDMSTDDQTGIRAQIYNADGTTYGEEVQISASGMSDPSLTATSDGSFIVSWTADGIDGDGRGVFASQVTITETVIPGTPTGYTQYDEMYKELTLSSEGIEAISSVDQVQGEAQEVYYRLNNVQGLMEQEHLTSDNYSLMSDLKDAIESVKDTLEPYVIKIGLTSEEKEEDVVKIAASIASTAENLLNTEDATYSGGVVATSSFHLPPPPTASSQRGATAAKLMGRYAMDQVLLNQPSQMVDVVEGKGRFQMTQLGSDRAHIASLQRGGA